MRILLVEDDEAIAAVITEFITNQHYVFDVAKDGQEGWDFIEAFTYDLILLDVMLPKIDGLTLCRRIRSHGYQMPILLLTARQTSTEKVMGLDVGADDYVVKPFDLKELGARIRALLRRGNSAFSPVLQWGKLHLDPSTREVSYDHQIIHLSAKEYSLLELFLRNSRRLFSRNSILDHLWSCEDAPTADTVKAHIKGLRQRLKSVGAPPDLIETVYGMGYRLRPLDSDETTENMPQILAAGLSRELTFWLQQRLGNVSLQVSHSTEEMLNELDKGKWSLLLLDQSFLSVTVSKVLDTAYSRLKQSKQLIIYCLQNSFSYHLPKKIVGQILFHPLDWEELARAIAENLELSLPPIEETRIEGEIYQPKIENLKSNIDLKEKNISDRPLPPNPIKLEIAAIWEKFKDKVISKITLIDEANKALIKGKLSDELRQQALQDSHKLAGSLGTFGFTQGSCLAKEIEELLQPENILSKPESIRLAELVAALHREIEKTQTTENPNPLNLDRPISIQTLLANKQTPPQILIVEDDSELAQRLAIEATAWGMQVECVNNLSAARQIIQNFQPDLMLLDLSFPDETQDGLTLLKELSQQDVQIPVIVLTIRDSFIERLEVARLGGCAFLHKQITPSQVMEVVSQVLQQNRTDKIKLMLVDDDPQILANLQCLLKPWQLRITSLEDPRQFWEVLEATVPDLLILDIDMPYVNGIELCKVIRNEPKWNTLPVLFLSSHKDNKMLERMFNAGADDYVSKPIVDAELITRIFNRLQRIRLLRSFAETDLLTGVSNRRKSSQDLQRLLNLAKRQSEPLCFALLDLDYFKQVNDEYGHDAGDKVLQRLGKLLLQNFRNEDVVARWGGEEFIIAMYGMKKHDCTKRLYQILETLHKEEFIQADGRKFRVSFSAGVVEYPADSDDLQSLYQKADTVLYQAKASGRDRVLIS